MTLILLSLATWRITYMVLNETGPFDIFTKLNNWIISTRVQFMIKLFSCFYCMSVYVAFILSIAFTRTIQEIVLYTLACSALAILLNEVIDNR